MTNSPAPAQSPPRHRVRLPGPLRPKAQSRGPDDGEGFEQGAGGVGLIGMLRQPAELPGALVEAVGGGAGLAERLRGAARAQAFGQQGEEALQGFIVGGPPAPAVSGAGWAVRRASIGSSASPCRRRAFSKWISKRAPSLGFQPRGRWSAMARSSLVLAPAAAALRALLCWRGAPSGPRGPPCAGCRGNPEARASGRDRRAASRPGWRGCRARSAGALPQLAINRFWPSYYAPGRASARRRDRPPHEVERGRWRPEHRQSLAQVGRGHLAVDVPTTCRGRLARQPRKLAPDAAAQAMPSATKVLPGPGAAVEQGEAFGGQDRIEDVLALGQLPGHGSPARRRATTSSTRRSISPRSAPLTGRRGRPIQQEDAELGGARWKNTHKREPRARGRTRAQAFSIAHCPRVASRDPHSSRWSTRPRSAAQLHTAPRLGR